MYRSSVCAHQGFAKVKLSAEELWMRMFCFVNDETDAVRCAVNRKRLEVRTGVDTAAVSAHTTVTDTPPSQELERHLAMQCD